MTMTYCPATLLFGLILSGLMACSQDLGVSPTVDMELDQEVEVDLPPDMKVVKQPGETCFGPSECGSNLCIGTGAGQFECMITCETTYEICENGSVCLPLSGRPESICYTGGLVPKGGSCQTNVNCITGHLCIGAETTFYCVSSCANDEDCHSGSSCLQLVSGASVCASEIGKICDTGTDCAPGLGCTTDDVDVADAFYPGICTHLDCDTCPSDGACILLDGAIKPVCLPGCADDSDCRFIRGWRCRERDFCGVTPDVEACVSSIEGKSVCVPPEVP